MRYGSVCSGIEAATAAWHHMNWEPAFFSEIEAFPRAVLEYHYPEVPLHGDFTTIGKNQYGKIDLLVGGTPCQSFSVAGLRGGLDDDRGNLALEFCRLAQREQPRWIVWENVPGVLSSSGGRDFGSILGALEDLGYGLAYRVLDAQYFGVAQRRRRVFVVGYLGDWRPAAAVLFERHSMSGHPAPSREARKEAARAASVSTHECGGSGGPGPAVGWPADVACTLDTDFASKWGQNNQHVNAGCPLFVPDSVGTLRTRRPGEDGVQGDFDRIVPVVSRPALNTQSGSHHAPDTKAYVVYPINTQLGLRGPDTSNTSREGVGVGGEDDPAYTLQAGHPHGVAYSIMSMNSGKDNKARETEVAQPIMAGGPVGGNQGGDYSVQQSERQEQRTTPTHDVVGTLCAEDSPHGARGLSGLQTMLAGYIQPVELVTPFDTTQTTSPHNCSSPEEGDPCHPLAAGAHPPAIAFSAKDHGGDATEELSPTLRAGGFTNSHQNGGVMPAVVTSHVATHEVAGTLKACAGTSGGWSNSIDHAAAGYMALTQMPAVAAFQPTADCLTAAYGTKWNGNASATNGSLFAETKSAVRRLTPVECERLQGFPDDYTLIPVPKRNRHGTITRSPLAADGPRYKALGNSMAVPVMRWIGERIQLVDDLISVL